MKRLFEVWSYFVKCVSFEWILTECDKANGGDVILLRSTLTAICIYLPIVGLKSILDPKSVFCFDVTEFRILAADSIEWFGAIFGAVYVALYTRFSSQWQYLASLYNLIKAAESSSDKLDVIAEWKAGFIEDAADLHLATKCIFASVIHAWGRECEIEAQFVKNSPGGKNRFDRLMKKVDEAYKRHHERLSV